MHSVVPQKNCQVICLFLRQENFIRVLLLIKIMEVATAKYSVFHISCGDFIFHLPANNSANVVYENTI